MPHCHTYLKKLRENGYRITPQREMVISVIAHSGRHMTAEEVYGEVGTLTTSLNIATVYRTLELLVENGLATRSDLGSGRTAYATERHGPHIHLVCRLCGSVIEAGKTEFGNLLDGIREKYGFDCSPGHFAIKGLCEKCRKR